MRNAALLWNVCLLIGANLLTGCNTAPAAEHDSATQPELRFQADQYRAMFEASVETLRDQGYEIERSDYRFGVITTKTRESATAFEFWIDDATTPQQHQADTLNAHHRAVTVRLRPIETEPPYLNFRLTVEVIVQRLQRPERYLTHSATRRLSTAYAASPAHLNERGITGPYAQTLTRDPYLEARLVQAIEAAAANAQ